MPRKKTPPPIESSFPSFKKIAVVFIVIAIILLFFIVYFSFAKATVTLDLDQEPQSMSFDLMVSPTSTLADVTGRIFEQEVEVSQSFEVENYKTESGTATGEIKIVNNHTSNQPLIKTTRFLSPAGILFRLEDSVTVPAGGEVVAKVYADEEGEKYDIEATRFTIPGLSASLQEKIYGLSEKPMSGGIQKIGTLSQTDIERAQQEFEKNLMQLIMPAVEKEVKMTDLIHSELINYEIVEKTLSDEVGQEVSNFDITAKVMVKAVLVSGDELFEAAKEKYKTNYAGGGKIISWSNDTFEYSLKNIDSLKNEAVLNVKLTAQVAGSFDVTTFDKSEIAGFDEKGIEYYFSQYPGIKKVQVNFSPFWVKSAPALKDRIEIRLK